MRTLLVEDDIVCRFTCGCHVTFPWVFDWQRPRVTHCGNHWHLDRRAELPSMLRRAVKMRDALLAQRK